jgi:hypothetical protein
MDEGGSGFRAKAAQQINHQADQQNQAKAAAANGWTTNIKAAAAKQEKKDNNQKECIHACKVALRCNHNYGAFPYPNRLAEESEPASHLIDRFC